MRNSVSCLLATAALLAAAGPSFAAGTVPLHAPAMLAAQDADQDGRLTLDEMRRARQQQVERFDADRDNKLSAAEYQAMWLDAAQARLARAFAADDKDHDGAVTADELIARASDLLHRRDSDKDGALTAEELRPRRRATPAR
jgi:Ca2+-binding EF-hand superfamily protein